LRGAGLALLIGGAFALQSCLVPQSVDPNNARKHVPPRIVVGSIPEYLLAPKLLLYPRGPSDLGSTPCHCHLRLEIPVVEMDDYNQRLEVRWFIDYDPLDPTRNIILHPQTLDYSFEGNTLRPGPVWDLEADAVGLTTGIHVVDVVIVEETGFDETSTTLPNRAVKSDQGYEAATYRFVVDTRLTPDNQIGATCPSAPPSVRTCP
jgi:hypothetical protein